MKKTLAYLLAAGMSLGTMAACGASNPDPQPAAPAAPSQETSSGAPQPSEAASGSSLAGREINVFACISQKAEEPEGWKAVADKFEAEYGVKVNYTWKGQWDEIPTNLTAAKLSGEKLDMVNTGVGLVTSALAPSGIILDLTDLIAPITSRWNDGILDTTTVGGKIWSMPVLDTGSSCIYYNKAMFNELGITEPKTYEELVGIAKKITDEKKIMPMIHQGKAASMWPMWFMETYGQSTGGDSVRNIEAFLSGAQKFEGGANEANAFALIKKFMDDGILTKASLDTDRDGMLAVFLQQKAAMFYGGTWEFNAVKEGAEFEWDVMEFPQVVDGAKLAHGGGPNGALVIPSFCDQDNLDATMQYIEFFTRPENNQIVMDRLDPLIACMKGITVASDPQAKKLNDQFLPNTVAFLDWIWPIKINDAFTQAIPAVMNGSMTPEEATSVVQTAYDTLVKEQDYSYDWYKNFTAEDWAKVTPKAIPAYEVK